MSGNEPDKIGGPVEVEIPTLKAREKEKKGAGVVLPGAEVAGNAVVAGGAGVGKAGIAALMTGKIGIAALVVGVGGAGLVGFGVMQQGKSAPVRKPELGGLTSSITVGKRNSSGSKSLAFMSKAGEGELRWDDPNAVKKQAAPQKDAASEEELADAAGANPSQEELMAQMGAGAEGDKEEKPSMGRMDAKLSTQLGNSSAFGSKSIFSGGTGFDVARMKANAAQKLNAANRAPMSARGKVGNLRRGRGKLTGKNLSTRGVKANRALGQLKFAGNRSGQASQASSAGAAAAYAQDAFGATTTDGGELEGGGAIGEDMPTVQPPGSGAPEGSGGGSGGGACPSNWTQVEGGGCEPPDVEGVNVTGYQAQLEAALALAEQGKKLTMMGLALIVLGAILWGPWGAAIAAIGLMLVLMGRSMSSQSKSMGQQIGNQDGQKDQGKIIERHGSDADTVNDANSREAWKNSTVGRDVEEERNQTYTTE